MTNSRLEKISRLASCLVRKVRFMEICGTHTVSAFRSGIRSLLPKNVELISGPGCPVCVTPNHFLDQAIEIGRIPGVILATFGDLVRVPASDSSLERERALGMRVRVVYSQLDALREADENPEKKVVFLGVGFETTTPGLAWTIKEAKRKGLSNFYVLGANKTVPPAIDALLSSGEMRLDGLIGPGHVSAIIGSKAYSFIPDKFRIPLVIAGFEPLEIIHGIEMLLQQTLNREAKVENHYKRAVSEMGNSMAQALINEVFGPADSEWRGLGVIPNSGLVLRREYADFDAGKAFPATFLEKKPELPGCSCGEILRGFKTPLECPQFAVACDPGHPLGPCMVSSEGTCAAYFNYSRRRFPSDEVCSKGYQRKA